MFSSQLKDQIDIAFTKACGQQPPCISSAIETAVSALSQNEQYLMKYIYGNLPLSDVADYPFDVYLSFVRHGLYTRENTPWGKKAPMELFLADVLFPRINNEKIEDHRRALFDLFYPHIKDKTDMYEAAVETNYRSAEYGTYRSPSRRTASPLTFLKRTFGRCGEESTFLVAVFRSLGIPARQIYTPLWPHCDDCHAWVEVWTDGTWHFLGACEPEPFLDKGWFNAASARAMLLHCRVFNNTITYGDKITSEGPAVTLSRIEHYANIRRLRVKVLNKDKKPVQRAKVSFELINYAQFSSLSDLYTDGNGEVQIVLGLGSVNIHVVRDGLFTETLINAAETDYVEIDFSKAVSKEENSLQDFDMAAPEDAGNPTKPLTAEERENHKTRLRKANIIRQTREDNSPIDISCYTNDKKFVDTQRLPKILESAVFNSWEVLKLVNNAKNEYAFRLLETLDEKDYVDLDSAIMESHINQAVQYADKYDKETFVNYVLAPRISFEEISDYRGFITGYFDEDQQHAFRDNPGLLWQYIEANISFNKEKNYPGIIAQPATVLKIREGSDLSKKVLFVAVMRSLGVPARINPVTGMPEYMAAGKFVCPIADFNITGTLQITTADDTLWAYGTNWSLARLDQGAYKTFYITTSPEELKELPLPSGNYRLITVNRLPNGNTLNRKYIFDIKPDEVTKLEISLREADFTNMLLDINLSDFNLTYKNQSTAMSELLTASHNLLIWLGEGEEPTEHILNEIIESKNVFNDQHLDLNILFIVRDENAAKNKNILRALALMPHIRIVVDKDFYMQEPIARNLYVDPGKLPLVMVSKNKLNAIYAFSGYNVGIARLVTMIIKN